MLGCHDGIPLLDLKGLLPEERIQSLISTLVGRGGFVKDLHGAKNVYYQVKRHLLQRPGRGTTGAWCWPGPCSCSSPASPRCGTWTCSPERTTTPAMERAGAGGPQGDQPHQPERPGCGRRPGAAGGPAAAGASEARAKFPVFCPQAEIAVAAGAQGFPSPGVGRARPPLSAATFPTAPLPPPSRRTPPAPCCGSSPNNKSTQGRPSRRPFSYGFEKVFTFFTKTALLFLLASSRFSGILFV